MRKRYQRLTKIKGKSWPIRYVPYGDYMTNMAAYQTGRSVCVYKDPPYHVVFRISSSENGYEGWFSENLSLALRQRLLTLLPKKRWS